MRATVPASRNSQSPAGMVGFTLPSSEKAPVLTQLTHLDSGGCAWGGPPSARDLTPPLSSVQRLSCILIFSSPARTFPSAFKHDRSNQFSLEEKQDERPALDTGPPPTKSLPPSRPLSDPTHPQPAVLTLWLQGHCSRSPRTSVSKSPGPPLAASREAVEEILSSNFPLWPSSSNYPRPTLAPSLDLLDSLDPGF